MNRQTLGRAAHEIVEKQYLAKYYGHHVIVDGHIWMPLDGRKLSTRSRPKNQAGNLFGKNDPYIGWIFVVLKTKKGGKFLLEPAVPGYARRPDIANIEHHHAFEVKPDNAQGIAEGRRQLEEFMRLLRQADREYRATQHWKQSALYEKYCQGAIWQGGDWEPHSEKRRVGTRLVTFYFHNENGVILWRTNKKRRKDQRLRIPLAKKFEKTVPAMPATRRMAENYARAYAQQYPEIVRDLTTESALWGVAAVTAAMVGIILIASPIPGDEAIAFAFAAALLQR